MNSTEDSFSDHNDSENTFQSQISGEEKPLEGKLVEIRKRLTKVNLCDNTVGSLLVQAFKCVKEIIGNISSLLVDCSTTVASDIAAHLDSCIDVMETLIDFLNRVIKNAPMVMDVFQDFPKTIASVLLEVFGHCKNSEVLYGMNFGPMGERLTKLFKLCQQVQNLYFVILTEHFKYDLTDIRCLQILIEALDILVTVGEIVIGLDVKTMAEQWKGICRLCEINSEFLKVKYVAKRAVCVLSNEISNNINSLVSDDAHQNLDKKTATRHLKVSNFILRILIKFAECFSMYLSTDFESMVTMLCWMNLYSKPYLELKGKPKSLIQDITMNMTIGIEPFLLILINNPYFRKSYFAPKKSLLEDEKLKLGYLLLTVQIVKALLKSPNSDCWLSENNIISHLLELSSKCSFEFSIGLKFEITHKKGDPPSVCMLYEYVLIHMTALCVTLQSNHFTTIEKSLYDSVLQTRYWNASLASDVWCAMARYGSATLCMDQLSFLIEMHEKLNALEAPQRTHLATLLNRLYNLLPDKHKLTLTEKYTIEENLNTWIVIRYDSIPEQCKLTLDNHLTSLLINAITNFTRGAITDGKEFLIMLLLLNISSTGLIIPIEKHTTIIECIPKMWRIAESTEFYSKNEFQMKKDAWMFRYLDSLSRFTSFYVDLFTNETLTEVTTVLSAIIPSGNSSVKIAALSFLEAIGHHSIKNDENTWKFCDSIVSLFEELIKDKSNIISVLSMEVFSFFSHNTNQESIVTKMAAQNHSLKTKIVTFLKKDIPNHLKSTESYENYAKRLCSVKYKHKCSDSFDFGSLDDNLSDDVAEEAPSSKKIKLGKTSDNLAELVDRMHADCENLLQLNGEIKLTYKVRNKILQIVKNLNRLE